MVGVLALALALPAHASLILLSETRDVTTAGAAGGSALGGSHSYTQSQASDGTGGIFSGNVSGTADWTAAYHADSQASQNSDIGASAISANGYLQSASHVSLAGLPGAGSATATSVFDVIFRVTEDTSYTLALDFQRFNVDMPPPTIDFGLSLLGGAAIISLNDLSRDGGLASGVLAPGDYQLVLDASANTVVDPLGDLAFLNYKLNFIDGPAQVPEAGMTLALLGLGLAALAAASGRYCRA
jgi:hypothetical protein